VAALAAGETGDVSITSEHPTQRAPRQERGRRRVDEILDAAEELVAEVGAGAASVQEIARRAGSSVGSIYHFFPTKDAIFDALRARFEEDVRAIAAAMRTSAGEWARLDLTTFVERSTAPFVELVARRPAIFALSVGAGGQRLQKDATVDAALREATLATFVRRYPTTPATELEFRVDVTRALGDGIVTLMLHADVDGRRRLFEELKRATRAYLASFETADGASPVG
jgi:AcrR family transcriptional regulator